MPPYANAVGDIYPGTDRRLKGVGSMPEGTPSESPLSRLATPSVGPGAVP